MQPLPTTLLCQTTSLLAFPHGAYSRLWDKGTDFLFCPVLSYPTLSYPIDLTLSSPMLPILCTPSCCWLCIYIYLFLLVDLKFLTLRASSSVFALCCGAGPWYTTNKCNILTRHMYIYMCIYMYFIYLIHPFTG